jgi:hypothetical protein
MATGTLISCPQCGHQFDVEDVLARRIEEEYKLKLNQKVSEIQSDFQQKESELQERSDNIDKQVVEKLMAERQKLIEESTQQAKQDTEVQIKALNEENERNKGQLRELRNTQIENERLKRQVDEQRQEIELEFERKMTDRLNEEGDKIRKREAEGIELKLREKDKQLADFKAQIDDMKRKAEQGSMQLQGEVQELALEELLCQTFQFDTVEEVGKGIRGADCIQTVRNKLGVDCGRIIYESKRTKAFSDGWVPKLKADALEANADICVIATEAMPDGMEKIGQIEGVWICSFHDVKGLAMVLRESLVHIQSVTTAQVNKGEKMQMLYDYLTGNEFKLQLEAIVDGFKSLQDGYNDEKLKMHKIWKEREKQLQKVLLNTVGFYGSIKGIAGGSVPEIRLLEGGAPQPSATE